MHSMSFTMDPVIELRELTFLRARGSVGTVGAEVVLELTEPMAFLKWVYDVQVRLEHQGLLRHVVDESRHVPQHFLTRVQAWEVHSGWVVAVHFTA